ncbi:hypothetical protein C8R44DRAFT_105932 [Mycena epipterygia]|nr:hypothetical protein C8R44DRAFT_105932 [Mycena epipterygia]
MYRDELLYQKRGFPLYVPEPRRNLSEEYRKRGVRIGDVGRVTPEGAFDFLFNIYCPSGHPINSNGVPDNFSPLPSYIPADMFYLDYSAGDYVSSPSVQEPDPESDSPSVEFPGAEFLFSCKGPGGAVLALPHGSHLEKLENLESMRRYATKNAESWYKYINAPEGRGRRLVNGLLYLITGCEKSKSWGMASFQNVPAEKEFQLSFKPTAALNAGYQYRWRRGTPARTKWFSPTQGEDNLTNQSLFLHGFSISLGESIWARLFGDVSVRQIEDSQLEKSQSDFVPFGSAPGLLSSSFFGFNGQGGSSNTGRGSDDVVVSEFSPTPGVFHPSQVTNAYLLRQAPEATVAITHDDDWCRIFQEQVRYFSPLSLGQSTTNPI